MTTQKIPILLVTKDRPSLLEKVLDRIIKYTDWNLFDLWILDNFGTLANKKIIAMYKAMFPFINIYSTNYNQLGLIQNEVIKKLKADFYIKIDDDIVVTENWTDAFVGVYNRNYKTMSFGSVVMPVNGFGWMPFVDIMGLTNDFKARFPEIIYKQVSLDDLILNPGKKFLNILEDKAVNEFLWNNCLNPDKTAKTFVENQNNQYQDLICPFRYSIGAIVFGHSFWEKMGGWKVQDGYDKRLSRKKAYTSAINSFYKLTGRAKKHSYNRLDLLADVIIGTAQGAMGVEEEMVCDYSLKNGYTIPVTTQGIAFHFAYGGVEQHLMNTVYKKIQF
jgi:hypothetical protein